MTQNRKIRILVVGVGSWNDGQMGNNVMTNFFTPLVATNGSMIRITAYSQIFVSALIPYLVNRRFGDNAKDYLVIAILALAILIFKGGYQPYHFY